MSLAIHLFELQAAYAERADVKLGHAYPGSGKPLYPRATQAYNNLTLANMKKGNYVFARLWCLRTLFWDRKNPVALRYQREIKHKLRNWKWPKTATGLYLQYAGSAIWETLCVREGNPRQLHVSFIGYRAIDEHTGELKGIFSLSDGLAVYRGDKDFPGCRVRMRLSPGRAVLEQKGDCGFGYGVAASGTFRRVTASPRCLVPQ